MKIYTKTGDHGETSLVGGQRVSKCCLRLESYGTIDELNSFIGMLMTYCTDAEDSRFLLDVQGKLFIVGGYLATDTTTHEVRTGNVVTPEMVATVEEEIDRLQTMVPPLKLFILPGGCQGAAMAHVCRTVCRRAERAILRLEQEIVGNGSTTDGNGSTIAGIDSNVIAYVNRLSDYFFVLARKLNVDNDTEDVVWRRQS